MYSLNSLENSALLSVRLDDRKLLCCVIVLLLPVLIAFAPHNQTQSGLTRVAGDMSLTATAQGNPGNYTYTLLVDGTERQYIVHVPPTYSPTVATAVVLNFHGGGSNAQRQMGMSRMNETADVHRFLVVYPEGTKARVGPWRTWNAGMCCGRAQREGIDDVKFTEALIRDLESKYAIDKRRIFATGMSNGAMMAYRLACELAQRITAIAPVGATVGIDHCRPCCPVSVLHFHGTADVFAPYHGGYGRMKASGKFKSVAATLEIFATHNKCGKEPMMTYRKDEVTCWRYPACKENTTVALCVVEGGGHTWPGGSPFPIAGKTSYNISANEVMWDFFKAHPMSKNP